MALITVNGIVTRYANYRDNDRILTLFTRERGLISAAARAAAARKVSFCRRVSCSFRGSSSCF